MTVSYGPLSIFAVADVAESEPDGTFHLVLVKAASRLKEEYLFEGALLSILLRESGRPLDRTWLVTLDTSCVRTDELDPSALFKLHDISDRSSEYEEDVRTVLDRFVAERTPNRPFPLPDTKPDERCPSPGTCRSFSSCFPELPKHHVYTLFRGKDTADRLIGRGVTSIDRIPDRFHLSRHHRIQRESVISGTPHVDREELRLFFESLLEPLHFLDFESVPFPVPRFEGTRPFQQIPFQFSLHIARSSLRALEHREYLVEDAGDPRERFLRALVRSIEPAGSILVFDRAFERRALLELAELFPAYAPWVERTIERFVDLGKVFERFLYYHPEQCGSVSLKTLLPILTGRGYADLAIRSGEGAILAYFDLISASSEAAEPAAEPSRGGGGSRIDSLRGDLSAYCRLDTEGMVLVLDALKELLERQPD